MDLHLTLEQTLLRDSAAKYIAAAGPKVARGLRGQAPSFAPVRLREAGDLGWLAIQLVGSSMEFLFRSGHGKSVTGSPGKSTGARSRSNRMFFVGSAFAKEPVALRPTDTDGLLSVYYCQQRIGFVDLRTMNSKRQHNPQKSKRTEPAQCVNHVSEHL